MIGNCYRRFTLLSVNENEIGYIAQPVHKKRFLRVTTVMKLTGLSRTTIYRYVDLGIFPKGIQLGPRCVGWIESEIEEWMNERIISRE